MSEAEWKEIALKAKERLAQAQEFIAKVTSPPFVNATVVLVNEDSAEISLEGRVMEVNYVDKLRQDLTPGAAVRLNPESYAIVALRESPSTGLFSSAAEILEDGRVVIEEGGAKHILQTSGKIEVGDRIMIDNAMRIVLENLGKKSSQYHVAEMPVVPWSKIGGLETTIELVKETVEEPFVNRAIYEKYGRKAPKGVLLYGPPGCGKTLMAKAMAYNLSERMKREGKGNGNGYFLSVKGPELLDKFVGNSEGNIRNLFERARDNAKKRGDVSVIFLDEAEALLKTRGTGISSDIYDTIVPQFLSEMDGMESNVDVVLVLATNRPDIIDPAVLRPGRIDRRIRIPRPNSVAARQIFQLHLGAMPLYTGESREELCDYATSELFNLKYPLFRVSFNSGVQENVSLGHLTSGAMIESISQRAAGMAIKREILRGEPGVSRKDLATAVGQEYQESLALANFDREDLMTIFPVAYREITNVERAYGGNNGN